MSELRIVTLGTSSGKPTLSRNVAAVAIMLDGVLALFDCGEGTQLQITHAGLRPSKLAVVCITHFHGDHVNGLPGFLSTLALSQHDRAVTVAGPIGLCDYFATLRRLGILAPRYRVHLEELSHDTVLFDRDRFRIRCARVEHRIETWGYRFEEYDRPGRFDVDAAKALGVRSGPLFGKLQQGKEITLDDGSVIRPDQVLGPPRPGRSVAYVTDTRPCTAAIDLARNVDLLVHEGTYGPELAEEARKRGHCTVVDAAQVAASAGAKQLVITHLSPKHYDIGPLIQAAREVFPATVIARDLDSFTIPVPE